MWYFITASTVRHAHYLTTPEHLRSWREAFFTTVAELDALLCAWVLLPKHYHILVRPRHGRDIGRFIQYLHGRSSRQINLLDKAQGRQIWCSYWDICIRSEVDFWSRFNYIHYNPIKHGYVQDPQDWEFSSYRFHLQEEGREWLAKCLQGYPEIDLTNEDKF